MSKGTKHVTKGIARKGKGKNVVIVPANNVRPNGKIVDTIPREQLQREIESLLRDLHDATTRNAKKGIRRKLRVRNYFISKQGGGLSRVAIATKGE